MSAPLRPDVQLGILEAVLAERFPKMAIGAIAARFGVTMAVVQPVLQRAGYPDTAKMRKALAQLQAEVRARDAEVQAVIDSAIAPAASSAAAGWSDETADPAADFEAAFGDPEGGRLLLVRVDELEPDPDNLRPPISTDAADIIELADSISEVGLLQPIVARRSGDRTFVVMGHRRLAALRRLHWTTTEAIVRGPMTEDERLAAMLIENGHRVDLDPISEARGLRRLQELLSTPDRRCTEAELARRIGRSAVFVGSRMVLLDLDRESQERVRRGELGIGAAGAAVRKLTGRTGTAGVDRNWHLGPRHPLAGPARARCEDAGHRTGRRLGAIACGACWEAVIRQDERERGPEVEGDYCSRCGAFVEDPHRDDCPIAYDDDLVPTFSGASA